MIAKSIWVYHVQIYKNKTSIPNWIELAKTDMFSKVAITTTKNFTHVKQLINEIINQSSDLKSFSFPSSLTISHIKSIESKLGKFKNCLVYRTEDIDESNARYLDF